jgi:NADPH:quinone reductase-like Zn-dependent oxidoreductase
MTIPAAVEFHVAGRADDWRYAQSEALGEMVERVLPSVKVVRHCIHPDEWEAWMKHTVNMHGFLGWNKSPVIWTSNGRLIGDETAFIETMKNRYGVVDNKSARQLMEIAKENLEIANRKREEATLGRYLQVSTFGDPKEVLQLASRGKPVPKSGEVRVEMRLAPVHWEDVNGMKGVATDVEWVGQQLFPAVPGLEGVGTVKELGPDVTEVALDDRVYIDAHRCCDAGQGTWAEQVICRSSELLVLPPEISDEQGALYLAAPLKAYGILASLAVVPEDHLLITNGECDTGRLLIQMAHNFGVKVIAGCKSATGASRLQKLGASVVVALESDDLLMQCLHFTFDAGVDKVVDTYGGKIGEMCLLALKNGGVLLNYGTRCEPTPMGKVKDKTFKLLEYERSFWSPFSSKGVHAKLYPLAVEEIRGWIADGKLELPCSSNIYDLDRVHEALSEMEQPTRVGKPLLELPTPKIIFETDYSKIK